jgi:hypothetical protein
MIAPVLRAGCGPALRKDDPRSLKDGITAVQHAIKTTQTARGEGDGAVPAGRLGFMLEMLNDLKNNRGREAEQEARGSAHARARRRSSARPRRPPSLGRFSPRCAPCTARVRALPRHRRPIP